MTRRLSTIILGMLCSAPLYILADEAGKVSGPIIEIYDYTGDEPIFLSAPSFEEIKKHGKRLFSDSDIKDLKPYEGFDSRFTLEVTERGKKQFLKTITSGSHGELVMVIDGKPRDETLRACQGCRVIEGSISKQELEKIRKKLARRSKPKQKSKD